MGLSEEPLIGEATWYSLTSIWALNFESCYLSSQKDKKMWIASGFKKYRVLVLQFGREPCTMSLS